ncbi:MAG: YeeE/YedE family protein [Erythrobacter sp.]|nr:YeeE/YedE family protein [Erythrobacter sp.]
MSLPHFGLPGFPDAAPLEGLLGGALIGLAAAIMLLMLGRIAGVSGLAARATGIAQTDMPQPVAALFVGGLVLGGFLFNLLLGPIEAEYAPGWGWIVAGGLVVGVGTRLGSGCTSGHGVCGMSRLSRRSLAATAAFMVSGFVTVAVVNALGGAW